MEFNNDVLEDFLRFAIKGKSNIAVVGSNQSKTKELFNSLKVLIPDEYNIVTIDMDYESGKYILFDQVSMVSSVVREKILNALTLGIQVIILPYITKVEELEALDTFANVKLYVKGDTIKVVDKREILMITESGDHYVPFITNPDEELIGKIASNLSPTDRSEFETFLKVHWFDEYI
ncbi:hypothetical protein ASD24_29675 [Paenibacillus sp. Root52]|uniref:hypothetical protein n=1 Tax=Paenibacillus sp. Root52 TaxID=1736552 RepID=UPI0006F559C8|nr:hypothetical protein [Paenibacillus sp. Root52]KQY83609.1 hypothetical protein ASD24_29675 [Paenibacillus sp. Root52]